MSFECVLYIFVLFCHLLFNFIFYIFWQTFKMYLFIYLHPRTHLLTLEGKRGRETGQHWCDRKTLMAACCMHPNQGPNPQPRHVPWPGVEPVTFHLAKQCPTKPHQSEPCALTLDQEVWLLAIWPMEVFTCVRKYVSTRMFIASLFVIIKKGNDLNVMNGVSLNILKYSYITYRFIHSDMEKYRINF